MLRSTKIFHEEDGEVTFFEKMYVSSGDDKIILDPKKGIYYNDESKMLKAYDYLLDDGILLGKVNILENGITIDGNTHILHDKIIHAGNQITYNQIHNATERSPDYIQQDHIDFTKNEESNSGFIKVSDDIKIGSTGIEKTGEPEPLSYEYLFKLPNHIKEDEISIGNTKITDNLLCLDNQTKYDKTGITYGVNLERLEFSDLSKIKNIDITPGLLTLGDVSISNTGIIQKGTKHISIESLYDKLIQIENINEDGVYIPNTGLLSYNDLYDLLMSLGDTKFTETGIEYDSTLIPYSKIKDMTMGGSRPLTIQEIIDHIDRNITNILIDNSTTISKDGILFDNNSRNISFEDVYKKLTNEEENPITFKDGSTIIKKDSVQTNMFEISDDVRFDIQGIHLREYIPGGDSVWKLVPYNNNFFESINTPGGNITYQDLLKSVRDREYLLPDHISFGGLGIINQTGISGVSYEKINDLGNINHSSIFINDILDEAIPLNINRTNILLDEKNLEVNNELLNSLNHTHTQEVVSKVYPMLSTEFPNTLNLEDTRISKTGILFGTAKKITYEQIYDKLNEPPVEETELPSYLKASFIRFDNGTMYDKDGIEFGVDNTRLSLEDLKNAVDAASVVYPYLKEESIEFVGGDSVLSKDGISINNGGSLEKIIPYNEIIYSSMNGVSNILNITTDAENLNQLGAAKDNILSVADKHEFIQEIYDDLPSIGSIQNAVNSSSLLIGKETDILDSADFSKNITYTSAQINNAVAKISSIPHTSYEISSLLEKISPESITSVSLTDTIAKVSNIPSATSITYAVNRMAFVDESLNFWNGLRTDIPDSYFSEYVTYLENMRNKGFASSLLNTDYVSSLRVAYPNVVSLLSNISNISGFSLGNNIISFGTGKTQITDSSISLGSSILDETGITHGSNMIEYSKLLRDTNYIDILSGSYTAPQIVSNIDKISSVSLTSAQVSAALNKAHNIIPTATQINTRLDLLKDIPTSLTSTDIANGLSKIKDVTYTAAQINDNLAKLEDVTQSPSEIKNILEQLSGITVPAAAIDAVVSKFAAAAVSSLTALQINDAIQKVHNMTYTVANMNLVMSKLITTAVSSLTSVEINSAIHKAHNIPSTATINNVVSKLTTTASSSLTAAQISDAIQKVHDLAYSASIINIVVDKFFTTAGNTNLTATQIYYAIQKAHEFSLGDMNNIVSKFLTTANSSLTATQINDALARANTLTDDSVSKINSIYSSATNIDSIVSKFLATASSSLTAARINNAIHKIDDITSTATDIDSVVSKFITVANSSLTATQINTTIQNARNLYSATNINSVTSKLTTTASSSLTDTQIYNAIQKAHDLSLGDMNTVVSKFITAANTSLTATQISNALSRANTLTDTSVTRINGITSSATDIDSVVSKFSLVADTSITASLISNAIHKANNIRTSATINKVVDKLDDTASSSLTAAQIYDAIQKAHDLSLGDMNTVVSKFLTAANSSLTSVQINNAIQKAHDLSLVDMNKVVSKFLTAANSSLTANQINNAITKMNNVMVSAEEIDTIVGKFATTAYSSLTAIQINNAISRANTLTDNSVAKLNNISANSTTINSVISKLTHVANNSSITAEQVSSYLISARNATRTLLDSTTYNSGLLTTSKSNAANGTLKLPLPAGNYVLRLSGTGWGSSSGYFYLRAPVICFYSVYVTAPTDNGYKMANMCFLPNTTTTGGYRPVELALGNAGGSSWSFNNAEILFVNHGLFEDSPWAASS